MNMKAKSNGIAKILSSKQVPIFQLTQDEATTIAHEHANLLDQRVKSDAESFLKGDLKTWLKQAQDLRKYIKENPTSQVAEARKQATMPIVSAPPSALSRAPDITLPGFCLELRRLRPPNMFDSGSPESVIHAQPSEPVAGVSYIDYRRHDGFIGLSQYSLLVDQSRLVKISVTELRAVVCTLGRDGSV